MISSNAILQENTLGVISSSTLFPTLDIQPILTKPGIRTPTKITTADTNITLTTTFEEDKTKPIIPREPLRFHFRGYSLWLELEETERDISSTIDRAANELGLLPVPRAHVTAVYGMAHLSETHMKEKFDLVKQKVKRWPDLKATGIVTDVALDGVNGGTMDMTWSEITYSTSSEHEDYLNTLREIFLLKKETPWRPHCSIAYDNPENSILDLSYAFNLISEKPSLLSTRKVKGISLWSTWGKMTEWKCIDRIDFEE